MNDAVFSADELAKGFQKYDNFNEVKKPKTKGLTGLSKSVSQTFQQPQTKINNLLQPKPSNKSLVNKFIHTINLASVYLRKKDESVTTFQEALKKKPKKSSAYIAIAPDPD